MGLNQQHSECEMVITALIALTILSTRQSFPIVTIAFEVKDVILNRFPFYRPQDSRDRNVGMDSNTSHIAHSRRSSLNICFHTNEFNGRGTTTAIYDYAHYNEVILGHKSIFLMPRLDQVVHGISFDRFERRFGPIYLYDFKALNAMNDAARKLNCDVIYMMKAGGIHSAPSFLTHFSCYGPPVGVHGIFFWEQHGAAFALLSDEQIKTVSLSTYESLPKEQLDKHWVPHIVSLPTLNETEVDLVEKLDYRKHYDIADNVTVFCRHGGSGTFDIAWVQDTVCQIAKQHHHNVHFIFLGTRPWAACTQRNNIHFVPETSSVIVKEAYFKACNAMLHGRSDGEMFSMAIAESSVHNLPVITKLIDGTPKQPVVLKNKAFIYEDKSSLIAILDDFILNGVPKNGSFNAYEEYGPHAVMERFSRIFIEGPLNKTYLDPAADECYGYFPSDITDITEIFQKNETGDIVINVKFSGVVTKTYDKKSSKNKGGGRKKRDNGDRTNPIPPKTVQNIVENDLSNNYRAGIPREKPISKRTTIKTPPIRTGPTSTVPLAGNNINEQGKPSSTPKQITGDGSDHTSGESSLLLQRQNGDHRPQSIERTPRTIVNVGGGYMPTKISTVGDVQQSYYTKLQMDKMIAKNNQIHIYRGTGTDNVSGGRTTPSYRYGSGGLTGSNQPQQSEIPIPRSDTTMVKRTKSISFSGGSISPKQTGNIGGSSRDPAPISSYRSGTNVRNTDTTAFRFPRARIEQTGMRGQ